MNWSVSKTGITPGQGQWPNPARPPDAGRRAPSSPRVGDFPFSSNINAFSPRSNAANYPGQEDPAAATEMGLRAGRNPRLTALRAGGDIASSDGSGIPTVKYNLVLHKKVDVESKTRFDRLQVNDEQDFADFCRHFHVHGCWRAGEAPWYVRGHILLEGYVQMRRCSHCEFRSPCLHSCIIYLSWPPGFTVDHGPV